MRVFTKRFLITFLSLFLGLSVVACGKNTTEVTTPNESVIPEISNPDDIFISTNGYDITYGDLYEEVKKNDGLNQLLMMVDSDLLSSYISSVTAEEITDKTNKLQYGTTVQSEIADLTADQKIKAEKTFNNSMILLGFKDHPEEYVKLAVARDAYAMDELNNIANIDESWYANTDSVQSYYEKSYFGDIKSIKIRFASEADAKSVLRSLNLVSKGGDLLLYTGETPLDQMPSTSLDETNTRALTNAELLNEYLTMYNIVYGDYKDQINVDSSYADVLAMDNFDLDYDNLLAANAALPTLMYQTLGTYQNYTSGVDEKPFYTYQPVKYSSGNDSYYYMILNLDRTEKADLSDFNGNEADLVGVIGQDVYDNIRGILNDKSLESSTFTTSRLMDLRAEHGFELFDYYLGLDYKLMNTDFESNADGDNSKVAMYDDKIITADQLLTYALNRNAALYTLYAAQTKAVVAAHFADVYCDSDTECIYDVTKNESDKLAAQKTEMESAQTQFETSQYAAYYTYPEYRYLAYGIKDDASMLYNYYVKSSLQPLFIYDEIVSNNYDILNRLLTLSEPYYDNYFNLGVEHLLIYVDRNEDGSPDDYDKFYSGLEDKGAYDLKLADFEATIRNYLADSKNTLSTLKSTYDKAKRDDPIWGEFLNYGFNLTYENLGTLTYKDSVSKYEKPFVNALIKLYKDYQSPATKGDEFIYDDEFVNSSYGIHLIKVSKVDDFNKPSGKFVMTYDDNTDPNYLEGMVNPTDEITMEQFKIYADYRFSEVAVGVGDLEKIYNLVKPDIPSSVMDALNAYVVDMYDALYVVGYLNVIIANQILAGTYVNQYPSYCNLSEAKYDSILQDVIDVYMYQILVNFDNTGTE